MKRFTIYILIGFYVISQMRPVAVVLEDVLAHTFWRVQHMATVHYENGHYHVHTQLSDISKEEQSTDKQKIPSSQKVGENSPQHISTVSFNFVTNSSSIPVCIHTSQDLKAGFTGINIPPPKIA